MSDKRRVDWNTIRAEYISGASYGDLSKKYNLSKSTIYQHAKADDWQTMRTNAANAARTKTIQKTANLAAENAVKAERIKSKLLTILERQLDTLPEMIGSSSYVSRLEDKEDEETGRPYKEKTETEYKLRDLAAMYKDLTADMPQTAQEETQDDGFLAALNGKAAEIWADGDDNEQEDSDV